MSVNKLLAFYIVWSFLHVLLWAFAPHASTSSKFFFPFDGNVRQYDISEFLVYVGSPVILYFSWCLYKK